MIQIDRLHLTGTLERLGENTYEWLLNSHTATVTIGDTGAILSPDASPEQAAMFEAAISDYDQPPKWDASAKNLFTLAQSAVDVAVQDLTTPQVKALLLVVLWDKKAIDNNLKVKPLREWVKRRPHDA